MLPSLYYSPDSFVTESATIPFMRAIFMANTLFMNTPPMATHRLHSMRHPSQRVCAALARTIIPALLAAFSALTSCAEARSALSKSQYLGSSVSEGLLTFSYDRVY